MFYDTAISNYAYLDPSNSSSCKQPMWNKYKHNQLSNCVHFNKHRKCAIYYITNKKSLFSFISNSLSVIIVKIFGEDFWMEI